MGDTMVLQFAMAKALYATHYSGDITCKDYYMYWLENDILLELNEGNALLEDISHDVEQLYPNQCAEEIVSNIRSKTTPAEIETNVQRMWDILPTHGRKKVFGKFVCT